MRINNNITAMNTHRMYTNNNNSVTKSVSKLSSGYRINSAADDAAGLAISEKMRAQIRGLSMASKNSQDGQSMVQTAEGALQETHNILQRMRELAVQSASDTNEQTIDRAALQQEFKQLQAEIDDIAEKTVFNDQKLIDGTFAGSFSKVSATSGSFFATTSGMNGSVSLGNVIAGTYGIGIKQVTTGYVAPKAPSIGGVASGTAQNYGAGTATLTLETIGSIDVPDNASLNGEWTVGVANDGKSLTLTSKNTGAVYTGTLKAAAANTAADALVSWEFEGIGTLAISSSQARDMTDADGISAWVNDVAGAAVSITGGVTEDVGTTKFYATMTGAQDVELKIGDTSVTFTNGISVNFDAITATDLARVNKTGANEPDDSAFASTALGNAFAGTITVAQDKRDGMILQTGANQGDELMINIDRMDTEYLNIKNASIDTREHASYSITLVNNAVNQVSTQRAALGALSNRLDHKIANLDTSAENLQAAESRIRDVDMAKEMTNFTKNNILAQASTAMLAQANALPQGVLQLLG